jgi:hypothetical protein
MSLRESLPAPWAVAATVVAGLAAGVIYARVNAPAPETPPRPVSTDGPSPPSPPVAKPTPPRPAFTIPGEPPAEIARAMEPLVIGAFRPGGTDADAVVAREEAFVALKAQVDRWAASSPRHPLASATWWRAALRRAHPTGDDERRGLVGAGIPWLGRAFAVLFSVPEGPGPFPAVVALVDGQPREEVAPRWGALQGTHVIVVVPFDGPVKQDPQLAMLALTDAGKRWGVDRDRVVLDGVGPDSAAAVAALAGLESRRLAGAVLRAPVVPPGPPENLAMLPVLAALPPDAPETGPGSGEEIAKACPSATVLRGADDAAIQEWIESIPVRPAADPRRPAVWATVTGDAYRSWGPGFVVRRYRGVGAGRPVRVSIRRDRERNAVVLTTENVAEILLLLTDEDLDLDRQVSVVVNGDTVETRRVERSLETVRTWCSQEPGLFVAAEMIVRLPE